MSNQHIYPDTQTRLAGEITNLVHYMRLVDAALPQIKAIADQIGVIDPPGDEAATDAANAALAEEFGFSTGLDARAAINLLGSLQVELTNAPFWRQVISRMG